MGGREGGKERGREEGREERKEGGRRGEGEWERERGRESGREGGRDSLPFTYQHTRNYFLLPPKQNLYNSKLYMFTTLNICHLRPDWADEVSDIHWFLLTCRMAGWVRVVMEE